MTLMYAVMPQNVYNYILQIIYCAVSRLVYSKHILCRSIFSFLLSHFPFILSNTHSSCNWLLYPCVDTACGQQKFICSQFICCNHAPGPRAQEFICEYVCSNLCDQPPEQTHLACQKLISGHICPTTLKTVLAVSW